MENTTPNHRVKILLVDDKQENLLSLQVILANQGYEFVEASSGKDALRILLRDQDFAIILMDVQMPLMDGFETAELIRESDKLKHVPIIFLTANMNTQDYIFKGYQAGAVDYMIKPLSAEILRAKVIVFAELYRKNHELQVKEEEAIRLSQQILEANEKLRKQYEDIEKQAAELRLKNKELDAFNYISSHDMQEPLRKIQTFVNLLMTTESENLSEDGKQKFQRIIHSTTRMRQLISSLLAFSRTNVSDRNFEPIDANKVITDLKDELQESIEAKGATIETAISEPVYAISFQFSQLLQNLLTNSLKFAKAEEPLRIKISNNIVTGADSHQKELQPDRFYSHLVFEDNGIGFEPELGNKIFEVFQKLHSKDTYEGTGIGLAICRKIVENHEGYITATGEPMKGARFDVYLPLKN